MRRRQRKVRSRRQLMLFVDPLPRETVPPDVQAALVQALADLLLEYLGSFEVKASTKDEHESQDHS